MLFAKISNLIKNIFDYMRCQYDKSNTKTLVHKNIILKDYIMHLYFENKNFILKTLTIVLSLLYYQKYTYFAIRKCLKLKNFLF